MASGGSSSRAGSGGRTFDFGSDDVLCSYDDFGPQDPPNGRRSDPSAKQDLHESRMGRSSVNFHGQENLAKDDVIFAVEKCMKKYADNLLRFLEGISGRLSQLEVYCYKLERSIGEFRADLTRDQSESDHKLNALEKHLQEVHRSVQILRDKQELAETQKELAKLQLVRKESSSPSFSKRNEEGALSSASETKQHDDNDNIPNQQLALALPHQVAPTSLPTRTSEQSPPYKEPALQQPATTPLNMQHDQYTMNQPSTYYPPQTQPEYQYLQPRPQMQDPSAQAPQQQSQVINQPQPNQLPPQFQPQWTPQPPQLVPQQMVQQQPIASQAQIRPPTPPSYPPYLPNQPAVSMMQTFPRGSNPVQVPYSAAPAPSTNHPEAMPFAYKGSGSSVSQPPQQQVPHIQRQPQPETNQSSFQQNLNKAGYMGAAPSYAPHNPQNPSYNSMFGIDGSRGSHSQIFPAGNYPSANMSALHSQQLPPSGSNFHHPGAQMIRGHPFGEMIEKAINMGYSRDHVMSVIHRMGETGQQIDFNALLDGLNTHAAGSSSRAWSG
ncbi:Non-specific serine/threonine protein kinase protein [Dioscorea alata]|uniref:Non-specific serine/threonine protein kinase protein n=1 Tax=Dioscorea alata TaxID=55571 RepID=A0ACB7TTI7_DIOAL|nr:Non-specific serine/threonine protein kinase protein [Dioscorea alata]